MLNLFKKKNIENNSKLLEIKYNLSSGIPFKWEYKIENNEICEFIKCESKGEKTKEPICGGNVETSYYFKGIKKGKTSILFKCINYADNYQIKTDEYKILVDESLNIIISSKKSDTS